MTRRWSTCALLRLQSSTSRIALMRLRILCLSANQDVRLSLCCFFLGLHIAYRKRYSSDAYCAESALNVCVCVGGTVMTPFVRPVSAHSPLSPLAFCLCSNSSPNNGKNCNTLLECSHQEAMPAMPAATATRDAQWPRTNNKAMTVQLGMTQRLPV